MANDTAGDGDVEFFGARIKVKSARLAALLNSAVTDDVVVVCKRARGLTSADERDDEMNHLLGGIEPPLPARDRST
jgi:hypothetical protein